MNIQCRMCSVPIERRSKHGNDPIFCTPKCRSKWHYQNDRPRAAAHARKWRSENRDQVRAAKLRRQYGLDLAAFDALLESQGGGCGVGCFRRLRSTNWHVDHDHACCPPGGSRPLRSTLGCRSSLSA